MLTTFQANNINCNNCSNLIKVSLEDDFGKINVNLDTSPVEVEVDIQTKDIDAFKDAMTEIGFDIIAQKDVN